MPRRSHTVGWLMSTVRELLGLSGPGCSQMRYGCHAVPARACLQLVSSCDRDDASSQQRETAPGASWPTRYGSRAQEVERKSERGSGDLRVPERSVHHRCPFRSGAQPERYERFQEAVCGGVGGGEDQHHGGDFTHVPADQKLVGSSCYIFRTVHRTLIPFGPRPWLSVGSTRWGRLFCGDPYSG